MFRVIIQKHISMVYHSGKSGTALSQLISISLFLEGEGGWELAEQ